jgi:hypothetical protein
MAGKSPWTATSASRDSLAGGGALLADSRRPNLRPLKWRIVLRASFCCDDSPGDVSLYAQEQFYIMLADHMLTE